MTWRLSLLEADSKKEHLVRCHNSCKQDQVLLQLNETTARRAAGSAIRHVN